MGGQFSQIIAESTRDKEADELFLENHKISSKEVPALVDGLVRLMPGLYSLDVKGCRLKLLPQNISKLTSLHVLRLEDNRITSLPTVELASMKNLREFNLARNQLLRFPVESLKWIENLTCFVMNSNQLSSLPPMDNLLALRQLHLESNEFTTFPSQVCDLPSLRVLQLSNNRISSICDSVSKLTLLEELHLKNNTLKSICPQIGKLKSLKCLDVSENDLSSLSEELSSLSSLKILCCQHNSFTEIPNCVFGLQNLTVMKFNDNKLTNLPAEIKNLSRLEEIYLQENELSVLPPEIEHLKRLRKMFLEFNKMESLPNEITSLKLNVLILHNNKIRTLPENLHEMKTLIRLSLEDNPLNENVLAIIRKNGTFGLLNTSDMTRTRSCRKSRRISRTFQRSTSSMLSLSSELENGARLSLRDTAPMQVSQKDLHSRESLALKINSKMSSRRLTMDKTLPLLVSKDRTDDMISPRRSKKPEKKTVTGDLPPVEKFKDFFRLFLDQQDFSKKRREVLKKMTPENKWMLMTQYKDSTLDLLKMSSGPNTKEGGSNIKSKAKERSPKDYLALLKERPNKTDILQLRYLLQNHKPDHSWGAMFIESGGISALSTQLNSLVSRGGKSTQLIVELLKLFQVFLEISLKSVLTTSEVLNNVGLHLSNPSAEIRRIIFDAMIQVIQEHPIGHGLVLEATNVHAQSHNIHLMYRFEPLMQPLQEESSLTGLDSTSNELRNLSLILINLIIESVEDLEERFEIRAEFMRLGIQEYIDKFKTASHADLLWHANTFESTGKEDYEDMLRRFDRKTVLKRMSGVSSTDMSKYAIGKNVLRVSSLVLGLQNHFSMQFNSQTLVRDVIRKICLRNPLPLSSEEFGLFVSCGVPTEPLPIFPAQLQGTWLQEDHTIDSHHFSSEILSEIELKLKPWSMFVQCAKSPVHQLLIDPNSSCAAIASALSEHSGMNPNEEYGLFISETREPSSKLLQTDDSKILSDYYSNLSKTQGNKFCYDNLIIVKLKPKPIKVKLVDNSTQIFDIDLDSTVKTIFEQIASTIGISTINIEDYGLKLISPQLQKIENENIWLENDSPLLTYNLNEESEIRLCLRPRKITVKDAETNKETLEIVDFSNPVHELFEIISETFSIPVADLLTQYCFTFFTEDGTERLLNNNQSLRSQGVTPESTILLKKKTALVDADVNIWDETENPQTIVLSEGEGGHKVIDSATFNILVQRLTSVEDLDMNFRQIFLMTYHMFSTARQLLEKLIQRYNLPPSQESKRANLQQRVAVFLKYWVNGSHFTYDQDTKLRLLQFLDKLNEDGLTTVVKSLQAILSQTPPPATEPPLPPPIPPIPIPHTRSILSLTSMDEVELAHQLSLRAYDIYKRIEAKEFFGQVWTKASTQHLAPNLLNMIEFFNQVSRWVATSIVSERYIRSRTNSMTKLIKTAMVLRDIKNYHLLTAFVSGMNQSSILRLKWTLNRIPKRYKQMLNDMEKEMSVEGSFKLYRAAIEKVPEQSACIPYIGVYLQDLIFAEDGNPDNIQNRINFSKFRLFYSIIWTVRKFHKNPYQFAESESIQASLSPMECMDEHTLYEHSLVCEPRGAEASAIL